MDQKWAVIFLFYIAPAGSWTQDLLALIPWGIACSSQCDQKSDLMEETRQYIYTSTISHHQIPKYWQSRCRVSGIKWVQIGGTGSLCGQRRFSWVGNLVGQFIIFINLHLVLSQKSQVAKMRTMKSKIPNNKIETEKRTRVSTHRVSSIVIICTFSLKNHSN
jgi:hypothetical protein